MGFAIIGVAVAVAIGAMDDTTAYTGDSLAYRQPPAGLYYVGDDAYGRPVYEEDYR